jgi:hypothetical protein
MIDIVPFELEHARMITLRPDGFVGDESVNMVELEENEHSHTVLWGDEVAAIVGGTVLWPGVMQVWTLTATAIHHFPVKFHKIVLNLIERYAEQLELNRMHMFVRADFDIGQKWAQKLEFKREGTLKRFGLDGSDQIIYARLF